MIKSIAQGIRLLITLHQQPTIRFKKNKTIDK